MNCFRMPNRWTMIKRHNIIVILTALIVSAGVLMCGFSEHTAKNKENISAKVFRSIDGWGYDILVNDTLFIHQEFIPAMTGRKGFPEKEQAEQTAQLIINKMKRGQLPTITTFELEQIFSLHETQYGQPGKLQ